VGRSPQLPEEALQAGLVDLARGRHRHDAGSGVSSQRRRPLVDRKTFDFYHAFLGYPKVTVTEVSGFALGGGFELALMADLAVVARDTVIGMPATRFLGPIRYLRPWAG
jgi:enoyl-CoA hydratase/carnithine racemase